MIYSPTEIKEILKKEGIAISKRRGQNFLVDARAQRRIIDALDLSASDEVLEIGPGLGALTEDLAKHCSHLFAIEKDKGLARIARTALSGYKNLTLIHQDILETNFFGLTNGQLKVVGNLPYYVTTPIVAYLLEEQKKRVKDIFITVQDEVGRRMTAKKGRKDYSSLSILVQYFTKAKILFSVPKRAFYPQPRVNSVFVHLEVLDKPAVEVHKEGQFFRIVRSAFSQRRKTICNALAHALGKFNKQRLAQVLEKAYINSHARAEGLSLDDFAAIEDVFYKEGIRF